MRTLLLGIAFILSTSSLAAQPNFDPISMEPERNVAFPPAIAELTFESHGHRLTGLIYIANGPGPHPTVVLLHGFPGNEKNLDIAQAARRAGFNVMFFHYRGAWGSEGDYQVLKGYEDALVALDFLREPDNAAKYRVDTEKMSVLGHSLGGYTSLATGHRDEGLVCVGAMSPVNMGVWASGVNANDPSLQRVVSYADTLFMLQSFSADAMREQMKTAAIDEVDTTLFGPGLRGKSVFMVVGEQDNVTPADVMFKPVVAAYSQDKKIKLQHHIISGDHSFSWSRLQLTRLVLAWLEEDCR
ncbi:MAG: alpha/beta fold hydrolase [Proteobacteria bacterium]|nr:alpha/beta fold hydrolase [Pseudomonadota bacterium]